MRIKTTAAVGMTLLFVSVGSLYSTSATAQFADDFSTDYVNPKLDLWTTELAPETSITLNDSGHLVADIVHADPDGGNKATYEVQVRGSKDVLSATGQFAAAPESGNLRFELFGVFFNRTMDGGPEPGERTDNVEIEIELNLSADPQNSGAFYCYKYRDSDSNSQPVLPSGEKCFGTDVIVEPNTSYTITVGIDRDTDEMFVKINEFESRVDSPYPFFERSSGQDRDWARFRVRDGAVSGSFVMSDLSADGESVDFDPVMNQRYKTGDYDTFDDDPDRSKEIVNSRLRMAASNDGTAERTDAFLRLLDDTNYLEADMVYSSESAVEPGAEGYSAVQLSGVLYNENSANSDDGNMGNVWASVSLRENSGGLFGEYCIIRADADDWSASTDLADGANDGVCPTFDLQIEPDQVYNAVVALDEDAKTINISLGAESKTYNIESEIFPRPVNLRARARIADGASGTVVGYWDNLRNDPNALTDEEINGTGSTQSDATSDGGGGSLGYLMLIVLLVASRLSFRSTSRVSTR